MNITEFTFLVWAGALVAGFLGSLTGLGGGVVLVPLLTIFFHVDLRYAIGASLVSVIATSSGAAAAYVKEGYSNIRIGMFLEIATTLGALGGAYLAVLVQPEAITVVFGAVLIFSALLSARNRPDAQHDGQADRLASRLRLSGTYPTPEGWQSYHARHIPSGFGLMALAGLLSGLLGIGSGAFKVLAMDQVMRLPLKVSTTTSNFMIGVTAAASAGIYFSRGDVAPLVAAPVALGVLLGAFLGTRLLTHLSNKALRLIFIPVMLLIALEMVLRGLGIAPI